GRSDSVGPWRTCLPVGLSARRTRCYPASLAQHWAPCPPNGRCGRTGRNGEIASMPTKSTTKAKPAPFADPDAAAEDGLSKVSEAAEPEAETEVAPIQFDWMGRPVGSRLDVINPSTFGRLDALSDRDIQLQQWRCLHTIRAAMIFF